VAITADPDAVRVSKISFFFKSEIEPRSINRSAPSVIAVPNLIVWIGVEPGSERLCFVHTVMKI
jgi:hypothetical protein